MNLGLVQTRPAGGAGVSDHSLLSHLAYADAAHTGFAQSTHPHTYIQDADADTYVRTEQSADEDIIRFALGGTERFRIGAGAVSGQDNLTLGLNAAIEATSLMRLRECRTDIRGTALIHGDVGFSSSLSGTDIAAFMGWCAANAGTSTPITNLTGLDFVGFHYAGYGPTDLMGLRARWATFAPTGTPTTRAQAVLAATPMRLAGVTAMPTSGIGFRASTQDPGSGAMTNIFGLLIEPQTGAATITNRYLMWVGALIAGTPKLRLDEGTPGANQTMLYLAEGVAPTVRRVEWKDYSALVAGDRVMVLV